MPTIPGPVILLVVIMIEPQDRENWEKLWEDLDLPTSNPEPVSLRSAGETRQAESAAEKNLPTQRTDFIDPLALAKNFPRSQADSVALEDPVESLDEFQFPTTSARSPESREDISDISDVSANVSAKDVDDSEDELDPEPEPEPEPEQLGPLGLENSASSTSSMDASASEKKRGRRRRRRRKKSETQANTEFESAREGLEIDDTPDEGDALRTEEEFDEVPIEVGAEMDMDPDAAEDLELEDFSTWNVPSWAELISGLYRPDR